MEYAILIVVVDHSNIAGPPYVTVQGTAFTEPPNTPDRAVIVANELGAAGWALKTSVSFDLPGETSDATFNCHMFERPTT